MLFDEKNNENLRNLLNLQEKLRSLYAANIVFYPFKVRIDFRTSIELPIIYLFSKNDRIKNYDSLNYFIRMLSELIFTE